MKYALNKPVCFQGMPHCSVHHLQLLFKGGRQVRCKRLWDVVGNYLAAAFGHFLFSLVVAQVQAHQHHDMLWF